MTNKEGTYIGGPLEEYYGGQGSSGGVSFEQGPQCPECGKHTNREGKCDNSRCSRFGETVLNQEGQSAPENSGTNAGANMSSEDFEKAHKDGTFAKGYEFPDEMPQEEIIPPKESPFETTGEPAASEPVVEIDEAELEGLTEGARQAKIFKMISERDHGKGS